MNMTVIQFKFFIVLVFLILQLSQVKSSDYLKCKENPDAARSSYDKKLADYKNNLLNLRADILKYFRTKLSGFKGTCTAIPVKGKIAFNNVMLFCGYRNMDKAFDPNWSKNDVLDCAFFALKNSLLSIHIENNEKVLETCNYKDIFAVILEDWINCAKDFK